MKDFDEVPEVEDDAVEVSALEITLMGKAVEPDEDTIADIRLRQGIVDNTKRTPQELITFFLIGGTIIAIIVAVAGYAN